MSVDEVINNAEALINGTEVNYTEASMNSLKDALSALKKIKAAYTTDKDPMLADIVNNYGKDTDRVSGYGSVKNAKQISQHLKVERVLTDLRRVYQHFWTRLYTFRHRKVHRHSLRIISLRMHLRLMPRH